MAARINRNHSERVRERIKLAAIATRLEKNALGLLTNPAGTPIEMTDGQIRSGIALLERCLARAEAPKQVNLTGHVTLTELVQRAAADAPLSPTEDT